jgi:HEAT repeat protein
VRLAAAKALGRIGGAEAHDPFATQMVAQVSAEMRAG